MPNRARSTPFPHVLAATSRQILEYRKQGTKKLFRGVFRCCRHRRPDLAEAFRDEPQLDSEGRVPQERLACEKRLRSPVSVCLFCWLGWLNCAKPLLRFGRIFLGAFSGAVWHADAGFVNPTTWFCGSPIRHEHADFGISRWNTASRRCVFDAANRASRRGGRRAWFRRASPSL